MRAAAAVALVPVALLLAAGMARAEPFAPELPQGAYVSASETTPATSFELPTGPFSPAGGARVTLEGARSDTAWRLRANQQTTLQILAPLREQLTAAGYRVLYDCETEACGGFDFRYALDLLPEPEMHVDLADFRYLAARKGRSWLALTVSRSSESGFVHLTTLEAQEITAAASRSPLEAETTTPAAPTGPFAERIEAEGSVALDDLIFATGAADLDAGDYPSLSALADYLATRPEARIALVGHTDTMGGLAANVALSKRRAEAVRTRLIEQFSVTPGQISAEGAGWLAPRTSNLTEEGRAKNRRVEAVLTSTPS